MALREAERHVRSDQSAGLASDVDYGRPVVSRPLAGSVVMALRFAWAGGARSDREGVAASRRGSVVA